MTLVMCTVCSDWLDYEFVGFLPEELQDDEFIVCVDCADAHTDAELGDLLAHLRG